MRNFVIALAGVLAFGLLVHGWDYAVGIGHPAEVPNALADYVLGIAETIITPERRANGEFGAAVEVDEHAPALDRLVAFPGRDPSAND